MQGPAPGGAHESKQAAFGVLPRVSPPPGLQACGLQALRVGAGEALQRGGFEGSRLGKSPGLGPAWAPAVLFRFPRFRTKLFTRQKVSQAGDLRALFSS